MRMPWKATCVVGIMVIMFAMPEAGCSKKDFNQQAVATVNGEEISVIEAREYLGAPAGIITFENVPVEQKRKVIDQLIAVRLVAQAGKAKGIDNTEAYKESFKKNEIGVVADALIRKEIKAKLVLDEKEVKTEIDRIKKEHEGVSDVDAKAQASKVVIGNKLRQIQKDLLETARKETGASIDNNALELIGTGKKVSDDTVLASVGDEKILYSDVKKIISETPMLASVYERKDPAITWELVSSVLEQDIVLRTLKAYAVKQGLEGSAEYKTSWRNLERTVIANIMFDNVTGAVAPASDEEVVAEYNRRVQEMPGDKSQAPPLDAVRDQLREILKNFKRQAMFEQYIEELRKQGKVTVNEEILKKL